MSTGKQNDTSKGQIVTETAYETVDIVAYNLQELDKAVGELIDVSLALVNLGKFNNEDGKKLDKISSRLMIFKQLTEGQKEDLLNDVKELVAEFKTRILQESGRSNGNK